MYLEDDRPCDSYLHVYLGRSMKRTGQAYNPKRCIAAWNNCGENPTHTKLPTYIGNPEHKRRPGDYGLTPPSSPRPHKTLCDADSEFPKSKAEELLIKGFKMGMVSRQTRGGWPQNIWSVDDSGQAFEAQLDNQNLGSYHGYPMPKDDPLRDNVLKEWSKRV